MVGEGDFRSHLRRGYLDWHGTSERAILVNPMVDLGRSYDFARHFREVVSSGVCTMDVYILAPIPDALVFQFHFENVRRLAPCHRYLIKMAILSDSSSNRTNTPFYLLFKRVLCCQDLVPLLECSVCSQFASYLPRSIRVRVHIQSMVT